GNAEDLEAPGDVEVLVHVELADSQLAGVIAGDLLEHRRDHLARPAPLRPEVDEDGLGGPLDLLVRRAVCQRHDHGRHGQRPPGWSAGEMYPPASETPRPASPFPACRLARIGPIAPPPGCGSLRN